MTMQHSPELRYGYGPIAHYQGKVLKCIGIITPSNEPWVREAVENGLEINCMRMPSRNMQAGELVILDGYHGDRIHADTHEEFTSLI